MPTPLPTSSFFDSITPSAVPTPASAEPTAVPTTPSAVPSTLLPTAASVEPTPSTTTFGPTASTSEPTSFEPAPVLVKAKLELKVTREEFQAEKENYVEAFAASAGVAKRAVTMYLLGEGPTRRALNERRELLEALQVICD